MLGLVWRVRVVGIIASLAALGVLYFRVAGSHARVIHRAEFREPSGRVLAGFFDGLPKDPRYDLKLINAQIAAVVHPTCSSVAPGFWSRILDELSPVGVARAQSSCTPTQNCAETGWANPADPAECNTASGCIGGGGTYTTVVSNPDVTTG